MRPALPAISPSCMPRDGKSKSRSFTSSGPSAARAAGSAGIDPGLIPFTAVLGLIRPHVAAEARCQHCGHRPDDPLASLNAATLALPRHRPGRQRTSGRTAAERRIRHTEEVTYTIEITKSNLPKWDTTPET